MIGKAFGLLVLAGVAVALALGWPDIVRFLKLKRLSLGAAGHPELVPAGGRTVYNKGRGHRAAAGSPGPDAGLSGGAGSAGYSRRP